MNFRERPLASVTLLSLASYRVTRAFTQDEIFRPLQDAIQSPATPLPSKLKYLLSCPHCLPPYVAAALLAADHIAPRATRVLTATLAAAAISTLITDYTERQNLKNLPTFPATATSTPTPTSEGTPPPLM